METDTKIILFVAIMFIAGLMVDPAVDWILR